MDSRQFRLAIARLCETTKTHYGKWAGVGKKGNKLVQEPLPDDPLPERFGVFPIAPGDDKTLIAVLDFDNHGKSPLPWDEVVSEALPIVKHLVVAGHYPMPFRSTGGLGIHVWMIWDKKQSAKNVRTMLTNVIELFGFESGDKGIANRNVEIFPKQDVVTRNSWGSCVDPPLAGLSCPLDQDTLQPIEVIPELITSRPVNAIIEPPPEKRRSPSWDESTVKSALSMIPADDYDDWVTVLRSLRGGSVIAGVDAKSIAEEWSQTSSKHNSREFEKKWEHGFPKERAGRGRTLGTLYWLARNKYGWENPLLNICCIEKIRVQESEPKLYLITIVGHEDVEVPMRSEELCSKTAFVQRVLEVVEQIVMPPKKEDLNRLLMKAERVETDEDATILGQFKNHLMNYLDEALHSDREELRMSHRAWRDNETGRSWFKWRDLDAWLRRQRHYDIQHTEAFHMVRLLKGGKGRVDLGKYGKQTAWFVPFDPREKTPEPDAVKLPLEIEAPF